MKKKQDFVEFTMPGRHVHVLPVTSWDIKDLDLFPGADSFYFFDRSPLAPGDNDPGAEQGNLSKQYVIAKEIWTAKQLGDWFEQRKDSLRPSDPSPRGRQIFEAVWRTKIQSSTHHAITVNGTIIPLRKGEYVAISPEKEVLWPPEMVRPKEEKTFRVMRPIKIRRNPQ